MIDCSFFFSPRLGICYEFFTTVSPNGRYFINLNGSALESIFSVLKHTSGGNLSAISYSPALGRLISRKGLTQNKHSEKGYRDIRPCARYWLSNARYRQ